MKCNLQDEMNELTIDLEAKIFIYQCNIKLFLNEKMFEGGIPIFACTFKFVYD